MPRNRGSTYWSCASCTWRPSLVRLGVNAKDVQDEGCPVDDLDGLPHRALEVGLLGGRELVVKDDHVGPQRADRRDELVHLPLADEGLWHRRVQALRHREDDLGAVRLREPR